MSKRQNGTQIVHTFSRLTVSSLPMTSDSVCGRCFSTLSKGQQDRLVEYRAGGSRQAIATRQCTRAVRMWKMTSFWSFCQFPVLWLSQWQTDCLTIASLGGTLAVLAAGSAGMMSISILSLQLVLGQ